MRTAEEILNGLEMTTMKHIEFPIYSKDTMINAINEARKEAIEECANVASIKSESCGDINMCGCQGVCEHPIYSVNKKSFFNLIKELK